MTNPNVPPSNSRPPRRLSGLTIALLIMTTLAAIVAQGLLWASQWSVAHIASDSTTSINNAQRAAWATPLFWVGIAVLSVFWMVLWRWLRWRLIVIPFAVTLAAASLAGLFLWRSQTVDQPVTITTYQCASDANPFTEDTSQILKHCTLQAMDTNISIGPSDDRAAFVPDTNSDPTSRITGLPVGTYHADLSSTAPPETASIILAAEQNGTISPLALLQIDDPFSKDPRIWSTSIRLTPDHPGYLLLYYTSRQPVLPEASITFHIQQCTTTSPTAFDPAGCQPMPVTDWVLEDVVTSPGPATWRQPIRSRSGNTVVYTNLEERTYTFTPNIHNQAITIANYRFLVIPTGGPQNPDANILDLNRSTAQESFSVDISPQAGNQEFTIYIFPLEDTRAWESILKA